MKALPSYPLRGVHLVAAWAYAVSQPVFSLLEGNPEFLVVRGASRTEVIVFALILTLVPPLAALACEWLVSLVWKRGADLLHLVFLGLFLVPLGMLILKAFRDSSAIVVFAVVLAAVIVAAYVRWRPVRLLFTFAVSLAVIGFVLFVARVPLVTEDVAGAQVEVPEKVPVVLLVLDELPTTSLTTQSGEIDAVRYPNFARLARGATWYPRATTVHESTTAAIPAVITGNVPRPGGLPTLEYHPENLFTLLGESYDLRVTEAVTYLCPRRYCPRPQEPFARRLRALFADVEVAFMHKTLPSALSTNLPTLDDRWAGFSKERILAAGGSSELFRVARGRGATEPEEFAGFLSGISASEQADTLHFIHLLLPHTPWHFLPSGVSYGASPIPVGLAPGRFWSDEPWLLRQAYARHLLQVGYTDRLLGRLLDRLERSGVYDRALVVVVADHGVSFVPGERSRLVSRRNLPDIAPVPLFVKFPNQEAGRVDTRAARTIDIVPTIADVLGVELPWTVDGRSLRETWAGPRKVTVETADGVRVTASPEEIERGKNATLRQKARFGPDWDSLLETGLPPNLVGAEVRRDRVTVAPGAGVTFDNEELFMDVATGSSFLPARITGSIEGIDLAHGQELLVAVNGRIAAATRSFHIDGAQRFSALVPEVAFRDGFNRIELFTTDGDPTAPRLTSVGRNPAGS